MVHVWCTSVCAAFTTYYCCRLAWWMFFQNTVDIIYGQAVNLLNSQAPKLVSNNNVGGWN